MATNDKSDLKVIAQLKKISATHPFSYLHLKEKGDLDFGIFSVHFHYTQNCLGTVYHFESFDDMEQFMGELGR